MTTVEYLRNSVINRILTIKSKDLLLALDALIASSSTEAEEVKLTKEQKLMLQMSERDIKEGNFIS